MKKHVPSCGRGSTSFALSEQAMPAFIFNTFSISTQYEVMSYELTRSEAESSVANYELSN
jgi:hypothetical protein